MDMESKNLLTPNEVTFILIGIMMDISVASLPNRVVGIAKQDGWISVIVGAVYPLYVVSIAIYISKKFPKENILILSKRYFGKFFGNLLNIFFLLSFYLYVPSAVSAVTVIIRTDIEPTLTSLKIYFILMLVGAYASSKGIKVLGRICTLTFIMILVITIPSIVVLKYGSYLNVGPIFEGGVLNILKASEGSIYDYACIEIIFLIYPFINDTTKIKNAAFKAVGITCIIYTWVVFISIYYMGTNMILKTTWSFFSVTEAIKIEVINNFRYVFVFFWIVIALKSIDVFYYVCMFILDSIKKIKHKDIAYITIGIITIFIVKLYYGDIVAKNAIAKYTSRLSIIYNLIYITLIAFLVWIKKEGINEKI